MRPHIYLTSDKVGQLRSVEEFKTGIQSGLGHRLWTGVLTRAEADLHKDPLTPSSEFPEREAIHARHSNADWTVCFAAGQRILRAALVFLATGDDAFKAVALRQIGCLFDLKDWPLWCDHAHLHQGSPPVDLRTGMLCTDLSLAYDWLHSSLSESERLTMVEGIDRRGIQPYLERLPQKPFWLTSRHNWTTCVVGGLGKTGMALGEDHPQSRELIDIALPIMRDCLKAYGPEGEFNESVGYAGAIQLLVTFFTSYRYHTRDRENELVSGPFPDACRWVMHLTSPPGNTVPFGDAHRGRPVAAQYFAAVAAATRDPVLQWFFVHHHEAEQKMRHDVHATLFYDDTVPAEPLEGSTPLGHAYHTYGKCISSRTDWNPTTTACMVTSKAGREVNHAHNDVGQVCIDGYGEPLIIDLGSCLYPSHEFHDRIHEFYNYSGFGHNIPMVGGRELRMTPDAQGRIVDSFFDRDNGAWWVLDTTAAYHDVRSIVRTVIHFFPGIVIVMDRIDLEHPEGITLKWHTVDRCEPTDHGAFLVQGQRARLTARVVNLTGGRLSHHRGQHVYKAPYDRNRLGELQTQKNESFIETQTTGSTVRLLSLFSVAGPGEESSLWQETNPARWTIKTGQGTVRVDAISEQLSVRNLNTGVSLTATACPP